MNRHGKSSGPDFQDKAKSLMAKILITINGEPREISAALTVADLLQEMQKDPRYLAVERNRVLVPRSQHAGCALSEGDQIEIVTLVGGG